MTWFILARALFVAAIGFTAGLLQPLTGLPLAGPAVIAVNVAFGVMLAGLIILFEIRLREAKVTSVLGALLGGVIGLVIAKTIEAALAWTDTSNNARRLPPEHRPAGPAVHRHGDGRPQGRVARAGAPDRPLPGGRARSVATRCSTPASSSTAGSRTSARPASSTARWSFRSSCSKELQLVADSADALKRNRGRRGLDILQKIQKMSGVEVVISDVDFPEVREVDLKLIELARTLQGKIVTNDFNLNKVAQLRGVEVLNINQLANSLKPVVLPGEIMKVFILKEGKEYNQGVAYLDDGTMVVVDNARKMISKTIDVVVTSVLQTTAGKMIFGRYIESMPAAADRARPAGVGQCGGTAGGPGIRAGAVGACRPGPGRCHGRHRRGQGRPPPQTGSPA